MGEAAGLGGEHCVDWIIVPLLLPEIKKVSIKIKKFVLNVGRKKRIGWNMSLYSGMK